MHLNGAQLDDAYACQEICSLSVLSISDRYNLQLNIVSNTDADRVTSIKDMQPGKWFAHIFL